MGNPGYSTQPYRIKDESLHRGANFAVANGGTRYDLFSAVGTFSTKRTFKTNYAELFKHYDEIKILDQFTVKDGGSNREAVKIEWQDKDELRCEDIVFLNALNLEWIEPPVTDTSNLTRKIYTNLFDGDKGKR